MCFKIYAYEEVEKKGKITRESLGARDSIGAMSTKSPFERSSQSKEMFIYTSINK